MTNTKSIKSYTELSKLKTFEERYRYLKLNGVVGKETFGSERYLNQKFYQKDEEYKSARRAVIIRDSGCDLGIDGREIRDKIFVHHLNPITPDDILTRSEFLLNPEYMICTTKQTHDAIHYGDESLLVVDPIDRKQNDTCPWKQERR